MHIPEELNMEHAPSPAFCKASSAAVLHEEVITPSAPVEIFPLSQPAYYDGYGLTSVFQPIYCLYDGGVVGFEALARTAAREAGDAVAPLELLAIAAARGETVQLDATLQGVHITNFSRLQVRGSDWLFLNVHPESATQSEQTVRHLARTLDRARLSPHRVVVEVLEHGGQDPEAIRALVAEYRVLGCRIALDDFGAGDSNFDRVWRLTPDIVKVDRSLHSRAVSCERLQHMIPKMVSLLHEMGCQVLVEGVESEREALMALDSGADLVQGYYFGFPSRDTMAMDWYHPISSLWDRLAVDKATLRATRSRALSPYIHVFSRGMKLVESSIDVGIAFADFLALPQAERCYLLDRGGRQHEANISRYEPVGPEPRCRERNPRGHSIACWATRPYFQIALDDPQHVHATGPYLSYVRGNMCITLSAAIRRAGELVVLCGDIDARVFDDSGGARAMLGDTP